MGARVPKTEFLRLFASQEGSSQFPGVLVGTPHVRKCHQMSSKEHIQLGWVVRWVLSTPPGHPAARRCVRVVPVLPLLLCTRPARARPSVGGQSPTPAPRQLPWSPPRGPERTVRLIGYRTRIVFRGSSRKSISSLSGDHSSASQPCAESGKPPPSPTKSREDGAWACFGRPRKWKPQVCSFGLFHRI